MKNTVSDLAGLPYDPLEHGQSAALEAGEPRRTTATGSSVFCGTPLAMEEELTPRQRQIMRMRYSRNMSVTCIAQELGINKATVSRTLSRSTWKLYRSLRYSL